MSKSALKDRFGRCIAEWMHPDFFKPAVKITGAIIAPVLESYWRVSTRWLLVLPPSSIHAISAGFPLLACVGGFVLIVFFNLNSPLITVIAMSLPILGLGYIFNLKKYITARVRKVTGSDRTAFEEELATAGREGWSLLSWNGEADRRTYRAFLLLLEGAAEEVKMRAKIHEATGVEDSGKQPIEPTRISRDFAAENKELKTAIGACESWLGPVSYLSDDEEFNVGPAILLSVLAILGVWWIYGSPAKMTWYHLILFYGPLTLALAVALIEIFQTARREVETPKVKLYLGGGLLCPGSAVRGQVKPLNAKGPLAMSVTLSCVRRTATLKNEKAERTETVIWYDQVRAICQKNEQLTFQFPIPRQLPASSRVFKRGDGHSVCWRLHLNSLDPAWLMTLESNLTVTPANDEGLFEHAALVPSNLAADFHPATSLHFCQGEADQVTFTKGEKRTALTGVVMLMAICGALLFVHLLFGISSFTTMIVIWPLVLGALVIFHYASSDTSKLLKLSTEGAELHEGNEKTMTLRKCPGATVNVTRDSGIYDVQLLDQAQAQFHSVLLFSPIDALIISRAFYRHLTGVAPEVCWPPIQGVKEAEKQSPEETQKIAKNLTHALMDIGHLVNEHSHHSGSDHHKT